LILKWVISLFLYILILLVNIFFRTTIFTDIYPYLIVAFFILIFSGIFIILKIRIKNEKKSFETQETLNNNNLIISTVFKNEGETVVNTVNHYMNFKKPCKMVFYDDNSDDGSFEKLEDIQTKNNDLFTVKRLVKSDKILHPKGMGFEDLIENHECDYYLILDADTIIDEGTLQNALRMMSVKNIKVLHFTRRNDLSNDIANNIADTEELFSTVNKVIGIFPWYFNGSGFIMKGEIAKKMIYDDYSPSDDCQISYFLRKNGIKVFDTLSLFAHEKAPTTVNKLIRQHSSWTKGGIHHYFEKEFFTIFPLAFISAYFMFSLINPLSIYNIFLPLALIFFLSTDFISNILLAKRGFIPSIRNAIFHTFFMFFKGIIIVPYHIFSFPFKRYSFWFKRTQY